MKRVDVFVKKDNGTYSNERVFVSFLEPELGYVDEFGNFSEKSINRYKNLMVEQSPYFSKITNELYYKLCDENNQFQKQDYQEYLKRCDTLV